jgi:hypothetical protein
LHNKLILLIGAPGSGKTKLLTELACSRDTPALSVGATFGAHLAALSYRQRQLQSMSILRDIAGLHTKLNLLLVDNIEILFDRSLKLDPLGFKVLSHGSIDRLRSSRISSQKRSQHKGRIQPGRHACSADDVAVHHDPCIHEIRTVVSAVQTSVSSPVSPREHQQHHKAVLRCRRKQESLPLYMFADERKHFFIVHQRLLPNRQAQAIHRREDEGADRKRPRCGL